jgi:hypothetical protein
MKASCSGWVPGIWESLEQLRRNIRSPDRPSTAIQFTHSPHPAIAPEPTKMHTECPDPSRPVLMPSGGNILIPKVAPTFPGYYPSRSAHAGLLFSSNPLVCGSPLPGVCSPFSSNILSRRSAPCGQAWCPRIHSNFVEMDHRRRIHNHRGEEAVFQ